MFDDFTTLLKIKRYSPNTIKTYTGLLIAFQNFIGDLIPIHQAESSFLRKKFVEKNLSQNLAYTTQKQLACALRLYLSLVHNRELDLTTVAPRRPQKVLPDILSIEEVKDILAAITNEKHRTAILTIYALGLRSGELLNLKIEHIDGKRDQVKILCSKGKKDRILPLPHDLKIFLRTYYKKFLPKTYLIENAQHEQYSASSLRAVFKKATQRAGIYKNVTLHSLRHSHATHLLDEGVNIKTIQQLLGHNDIKTTLIYTHITTNQLFKLPNLVGLVS